MPDEAAKNPLVRAALGGEAAQDVIYNAMNPQHQIVTGQGAILSDSVGVPWSGAFPR